MVIAAAAGAHSAASHGARAVGASRRRRIGAVSAGVDSVGELGVEVVRV